MATFTVTIPDATVPRIRASFPKIDPQNVGKTIPATPAQVIDEIKIWLKAHVEDYEADQAAVTKRDTVRNETW